VMVIKGRWGNGESKIRESCESPDFYSSHSADDSYEPVSLQCPPTMSMAHHGAAVNARPRGHAGSGAPSRYPRSRPWSARSHFIASWSSILAAACLGSWRWSHEKLRLVCGMGDGVGLELKGEAW